MKITKPLSHKEALKFLGLIFIVWIVIMHAGSWYEAIWNYLFS